MSFLTLLLFLTIIQLRRFLKKSSLLPEWQRIFNIAMYVVIGLFVLQAVFRFHEAMIWIWHVLLVTVIGITYFKEEFLRVRPFMIALLPYVVISLIADILEILFPRVYDKIDPYLDVVKGFAFIWLVAMLIIANKQRKALEKERKLRQQEEEQHRIMEARKLELEEVVAERTLELTEQKEELQHALMDLKATQTQLVHREKMASLGELTAGIAHEIQNPLNFVNNFSELSVELANELQQVINKLQVPEEEKENLTHLLHDLLQNQQKINYHGRRADAIVKGMLLHSRKSTGQKELTDINALADEYLRLSYHGLRAKDKSINAKLQTDYDNNLEKINVIPQDIGRVFLNLFTNAFYSVGEKKKQVSNGYEPIVSVTTRKINSFGLKNSSNEQLTLGGGVEIIIRDNGVGIPRDVLNKIYQPFYSTKPTGQGTGLGLSISYDIITKVHGGEIRVETTEGEFAEFIIYLPS